MSEALVMGTVLGLSAGISPGPLLALVVSHSLQYGTREGIKVAFAPLITDVPIVAATLLALHQLADFQFALGAITLSGGFFLVYLGYENLRSHGLSDAAQTAVSSSFAKGALVNALSPHPYLFWLTVGAPLVCDAWTKSHLSAAAFLLSFYLCLVGSKVVIAMLTGMSRGFLSGKRHLYILRFLGAIMFLFAILLFGKGLELMGIW